MAYAFRHINRTSRGKTTLGAHGLDRRGGDVEITYNLADGKVLSSHVTAHAPDGFQRKGRGWKSPTAAVH